MRAGLAALAFVLLATGTPAYALPSDLSGVWIAREVEETPESAGYFRAELSPDDTGRLSGEGVVDPCTRCAGFGEYGVTWRAGVKSGVLVLTGTPSQQYRRGIVIFRGRAVGDRYEGVLTGLSWGRSMQMVLERAQHDE